MRNLLSVFTGSSKHINSGTIIGGRRVPVNIKCKRTNLIRVGMMLLVSFMVFYIIYQAFQVYILTSLASEDTLQVKYPVSIQQFSSLDFAVLGIWDYPVSPFEGRGGSNQHWLQKMRNIKAKSNAQLTKELERRKQFNIAQDEGDKPITVTSNPTEKKSGDGAKPFAMMGEDALHRFCHSLRATGSMASIVMFSPNEHLASHLAPYNGTLIEYQTPFATRMGLYSFSSLRFTLYSLFLTRYASLFSFVMTTDVWDVVFQMDPFVYAVRKLLPSAEQDGNHQEVSMESAPPIEGQRDQDSHQKKNKNVPEETSKEQLVEWKEERRQKRKMKQKLLAELSRLEQADEGGSKEELEQVVQQLQELGWKRPEEKGDKRQQGESSLSSSAGKKLIIAQEMRRFTPSDINSYWVRQCFGSSVAQKLQGEVVSCSGTTIGSKATMLDYVTSMDALSRQHFFCGLQGMDQGVHNYLMHSTHFSKIAMAEHPEEGHFLTMDSVTTVRFEEAKKGMLLNKRGEAYVLLHQINRCYNFVKHFQRRAEEGSESDGGNLVFKSASDLYRTCDAVLLPEFLLSSDL